VLPEREGKKKKDYAFGVNLLRSPVLYRAAQLLVLPADVETPRYRDHHTHQGKG